MKVINVVSEYKIRIPIEQSRQFRNLIDAYSPNAPSKELQTQMLNIFTPYIRERADYIAQKKRISADDYFQELCCRFLQYIDRYCNTKYPASRIADKLNNVKTTEDDIISVFDNAAIKSIKMDILPLSYKTEDQLTSEVVLNNLSYIPDNKTLTEKGHIIWELVKPCLKGNQKKVMTMFMEGKSFDEIAHEIGIKTKSVHTIYLRAITRIRQLDKKGILSNIYYYGDNVMQETKPSNKVNTVSNHTLINCETYDPEEIRATVKRNEPPIDVLKELYDIMATQTRYESIFTNIYLAARVKNFLKKDPDFRFKIKLPDRCNNDSFKRKVRETSVKYFGINIFKYI